MERDVLQGSRGRVEYAARLRIDSPFMEVEIRRGITPGTLLKQIENTAAFLFNSEEFPQFKNLPYVKIILETQDRLQNASSPSLPARLSAEAEQALFSHFEYFRLCVAAHWCTVATFVPTDVDNQIRLKLWNPSLPSETLTQMGQFVCETLHWDPQPVTTREVRSPLSGELMCGHHGEWFSIAVGAYVILRKRDAPLSQALLELIFNEMNREKQIFEDLISAQKGADLLRASTIIAHNLGDLDRAMDLWNLTDLDPLRVAAYQAGHSPLPRFGKTLCLAGEINKKYMAHENHRHLPMRAAKCLRRKPEYLLPLGPFFDDWGSRIARDPSLSLEEVAQVVEALVSGWEKLNHPIGYARALHGLIETFPGQLNELAKYLPARITRTLKSGELRTQYSMSREKFERQWNQRGLALAQKSFIDSREWATNPIIHSTTSPKNSMLEPGSSG